MKGTYLKNLLREIRSSLSRFLSIAIVIAVGVAFYAGIRATCPDMQLSGDVYFNETRLMDFKVVSTLGLTNEDAAAVETLPGVAAEGAYSVDAVYQQGQRTQVLNLCSLPAAKGINGIWLTRGRLPENGREAVVEERFLADNGLKLGDTVTLSSGTDRSMDEKLNRNTFVIVGAAQSPLFVSVQRQISAVGNGSVRGFVYLLPEVFKSEVYTELYVKLDGGASEQSLLNPKAYKTEADSAREALIELGEARSAIRYEQVVGEARSKLDDAQAELNRAKAEAADKIAQGYRRLDAAKQALAAGNAKLKENRSLFSSQMAEGEAQIRASKERLQTSREQLAAGKKQAAEQLDAAVKARVDAAKQQLDSDPENAVYLASYNAISSLYEAAVRGRDFDSQYALLKESGALSQVQALFDLEALKTGFDRAKTEIEAGETAVAKGETDLQKARQQGEARLTAAQKALDDGQKKIDSNTAKLKAEEEKANRAIRDGEAKLQESRDALNQIEEPAWYILGRSENVGYETYRLDSERIGKIGKVFPLIFFLVAALVSLTTMTRMVQEKRTEIGTFKALGYPTGQIVAHYLLYALAASLLGSLLGSSFAFRLFPPLIMRAYGSLYTIPGSVAPFHFGLALEASSLAVAFTTVAAIAAVLEELRAPPAALMRPKPPKSGKPILLERVTFIWKRMGFIQKVTARNLFRYKQRFFMTVIGIAACTGLMISGFGLREGILDAMEKQFSDIYRFDLQATLNQSLDRTQEAAIKAEAMNAPHMKAVLFTYIKNGTVSGSGSEAQDVHILVPETREELGRYIHFTTGGKPLALDDQGVILTRKLAGLLHKKAGDTVSLTLDGKTVSARVSAVTEHYISHYVYISPACYGALTGETFKSNSFFALLDGTTERNETETSRALTRISDVVSVSYKNNTHIDYQKSMDSVNSVVLILIASAGVLAFVVIYNLTNINMTERRRELATIKLLGFYDQELASYLYRENTILTILGSLSGILMGLLLNGIVLNTVETNVVLFSKTIDPIYFVLSIGLTVLFSLIVNLAMYKKFDTIDMIESLKSVE